MALYKVQRIYFKRPGYKRTIYDRLTIDEARQICSDPETSSRTCVKPENIRRTKKLGPWFDTFTEM